MKLDNDMTRLIGSPDVLDSDVEILCDDVMDPVIVQGLGETILLNDDEREALKLGPKFCVFNDLNEEVFEADIEECLLKVKWDMMGDEATSEDGDWRI